MFSVKSFVACAALAVSAAALVTPEAAEAGVVIKSSGPSAGSFPVGKKVDDQGRITLKAGDSVTILSNGKTRIISGAGTHRIAQRGAAKRSTYSILTRKQASTRSRAGVSRGTEGGQTPQRSNIWHVDVSQSGTMCVSDPAAVSMWRPGFGMASTYVVANASSPEHVHVSFASDSMTTPWDAARMPITDGAQYTITGPDGTEPVAITFAVFDSEPVGPEAMAEALIAKGCTGQLDLLAAALM